MKSVLAAVVTAVLYVIGSGVTFAQERLLLNSMAPAGGPHSAFQNAWAKRVTDASKGALVVEVRDGFTLANMSNAYERTMDDVIQIGWIQLALVSGKFPISTLTDLPFMSDGTVNCSVAAWRLYKSGLVDAEYKDIVPLWFTCLGQNGLHFNKAPTSNVDLGARKVRVASKLASQMVENMGGTPISMGPETVYESLQRGTLDGAVTSWPAFGPQKFFEVTNYHLEVPVGSTVTVFFMAKKKFDALPEASRKAIMDNSGEAQSRAMGEFINGQAVINRDVVAKDSKHQIVQLGDAETKIWQTKLAPLQEGWIKANPGGDKAIEFYKKAHADSAAGR